MIKSLSKTEYYKDKNIPMVTFCRKLQPEQPARTHLIEALPRLGSQLEKIKSLKNCQNRVNLELANALKIIHQLQYELQILTEKYQENEEQLFSCRDQKKELQRRISKLEERVVSLQGQIQKNQFNMKAKAQSERQQHYSMVGQYERKIEELTYANNKLKADREKEMKSTQQFHEASLSNINSQLHSFQSASQIQIAKLQKQLEKFSQENQSLLRKITDLETFNQQHLQDLKKTNTQLIQVNLQTKIGLEHKIVAIQVELDLSLSKNKQLLGSLEISQKKLLISTRNWIEERNTLTQRQLESENSWKKSYDQLVKRKQNVIQELNKRNSELSEKERQLITMTDLVRKSEARILDLQEQNRNITNSYENYRMELNKKYQEDYEFKLNEEKILYQRQTCKRISQAIQKEHRQLNEKKIHEIQKYVQKITSLEGQIFQINHDRLNKDELLRKLQVTIQQSKNEIEYLNKANADQNQSFNARIQNLTSEYESKIKSYDLTHFNELEKLKGQATTNLNLLRNQYEIKVRDLVKNLQSKDWECRNLQNKIKKIHEDNANERISFISRVQSFEVTVGKMRNENENLLNTLNNLQQNLDYVENENKNLHCINQQEARIKQTLVYELNVSSQINQKLKQDAKLKEENWAINIKELEIAIYEQRKKNSALSQEMQMLRRVNRDQSSKCENLLHKLKLEEQNRMNLQKKLCDIDLTSQQKWKAIESDFINTNKRFIEDSQRIEQDLRCTIKSREEQINQMAMKIDQLELTSIQEKSQYQINYANWTIKLNQLEQHNKNLLQANFIVEDLKNDNRSKENIICELQKQIKKAALEAEQKQNQILHLNRKTGQDQHVKDKLKSQIQQKVKEIMSYQQRISELERQYVTLKETSEIFSKKALQKQVLANQELRKQKDQNHNIQNQLKEETTKFLRILEERKKDELKIQALQKQLNQSSRQRNLQKLEASRKISELQLKFKTNQDSFNQRIKHLESQIVSKNQTLRSNQAELQKILILIKESQGKMEQNSETIKDLKQKLNKQKLVSEQYKLQLSKLQNEKAQFDRKLGGFLGHIEKLEKQIEKTEKQIAKIYEESDQRVQIAYEETKVYYERELDQRNTQINDLRQKAKKQLEEQKEEHRRRQSKINEEKQQLYKETIEKTWQITDITNSYEELTQTYEHVLKELQVYKKKWNKMFCQFTDTNEELSQANIKIRDFRTDDKKNKKVVRQIVEVRTEKTEKFMTTAGNQTPVSQNIGSKGHENNGAGKSVNPFDQSIHEEASRRSTQMGRLGTPIIISNILPGQHKEANLDVSVRQDWSSTSSKFSFKE